MRGDVGDPFRPLHLLHSDDQSLDLGLGGPTAVDIARGEHAVQSCVPDVA